MIIYSLSDSNSSFKNDLANLDLFGSESWTFFDVYFQLKIYNDTDCDNERNSGLTPDRNLRSEHH